MKAEQMNAPGAAAETAHAALRQAKRSLRREMAAKLNILKPEAISSQSQLITSHIVKHPAFEQANKISIYVSMEKGEVRTEELCKQTLALGKRLYVPRFAVAAKGTGTATTFESDMRMLRIQDWNDFEAMVMNKWGIREPEEFMQSSAREDALDDQTGGDGLDLILAPGVAFDAAGGRLGHGKGYYDRYILRCEQFQRQRRRPGPVTIALALQEQILPEPQRVPADDQDRKLDVIMTSTDALSHPLVE